MKIFGVEFKFNGFDIWHKGNFTPPTSLPANGGNADTVDNFHLDQGVTKADNPTFNSLNAGRLYQVANGIPSSNLGNPSVAEMALFDAEFTNKLWFYNPAKLIFEYTNDDTNWITLNVTNEQIKAFVSGNSNASINIPRDCIQFRITIDNDGIYVYLNSLYMYWSSQGNSSKVTIEKKRDDGDWIAHTSSATNVSAYPGHLYLPFNVMPFSTAQTAGHYSHIRIIFTPTWVVGNANGISLQGLEIWGGYPSGKRTIYSWDSDKNVIFPGKVTATTLVGSVAASQVVGMPTKLSQLTNDIGAGGGVKITTSATEPSTNSPGDFWYKEG